MEKIVRDAKPKGVEMMPWGKKNLPFVPNQDIEGGPNPSAQLDRRETRIEVVQKVIELMVNLGLDLLRWGPRVCLAPLVEWVGDIMTMKRKKDIDLGERKNAIQVDQKVEWVAGGMMKVLQVDLVDQNLEEQKETKMKKV